MPQVAVGRSPFLVPTSNRETRAHCVIGSDAATHVGARRTNISTMGLPERRPAKSSGQGKRTLGKGVFRKCEGCGATLNSELLAQNWEVCPECGHHHRLPGDRWKALIIDDGSFAPWETKLRSVDLLGFSDGKTYKERLAHAEERSGETEAFEIGAGSIGGIRVAYGGFLFNFMGGSMGSVVGELLARLFERAAIESLPAVVVHASGGARMQEGILSLMQMGKTVAALARYRRVGQPFISLLTHPTTGGVAASTALLGDINISEPNALIGFAGPRVIESTLKTTLPKGFQRAELLLEHGQLDDIVPRAEMKLTLSRLLLHLTRSRREQEGSS